MEFKLNYFSSPSLLLSWQQPKFVIFVAMWRFRSKYPFKPNSFIFRERKRRFFLVEKGENETLEILYS